MLSLNKRALIVGTLIITAFFALAGISLQKAFDRNARSAMTQRLLGQVYVLIAAMGRRDNGEVYMPDSWRNDKVLQISPNLMAEIQYGKAFIWQSPAMAELAIDRPIPAHRNQYSLTLQPTAQGGVGVLSYAVAWGGASDHDLYYLRVAEDLIRYERQRDEFTHTLWISLAGVALVLLLVQSQMLRWELLPLRTAHSEIDDIRHGRRERLSANYPGELQSLTDGINRLLSQQQAQITRYRHSLGDLAHSLKTPLAILQNALSSDQHHDAQYELLRQQVSRINEIASYQLARAATAGSSGFQKLVNIAELTHSVIKGLNKVYANKAVNIQCHMDEFLQFAIDEGDFIEVLGNLLDNAYKWCRSKVSVHIEQEAGGLSLSVSDDGRGFSQSQLQQGPTRGARGDADMPGHGLGLAMSADIVDAYHGRLQLTNIIVDEGQDGLPGNPAGEVAGARVSLHLPAIQMDDAAQSASANKGASLSSAD